VKYDEHYGERITLRDGTIALLRLVRSEDKALLVDGFEHLSPQSRYRRFFAAKKLLSDRDLRYLTELDGSNHLAIGAVDPSGKQGLGIARFVRRRDEPEVAEAAVAVRDDLHGRGLGRALLERLAAAAYERGVRSFRSEILASNREILALVEAMAPHAQRRRIGDLIVVDHELSPEGITGSSLERVLLERARGTLPVVGEDSR
jgi:GNAT superfamily N-acetyltransferase